MYVVLGTTLALVIVFAISVAGKAHPDSFRTFVSAAGPLSVLPRSWRSNVAKSAVAAEVIAFLGLAAGFVVAFFGGGRLISLFGFLVAGALLIVFTIAILFSLRRGDRTPCRCFGASATPLGAGQVMRNAVLVVVALGGAIAIVTEPSGGQPLGLVVAAVAGIVVGALAVRSDDLIELFREPAVVKE